LNLDNSLRFGLWEEGKRIEWFDSNIVNMINNGKIDYTTFFNKDESSQVVDAYSIYEAPKDFNLNLDMVKKLIKVSLKTEQ
jgi:hypothetical protein